MKSTIRPQIRSSVQTLRQRTSYYVGAGLVAKLHEIPEICDNHFSMIILLIDENVDVRHGRSISDSLKKTHIPVRKILLPIGEAIKDMSTFTDTLGRMFDSPLNRRTLLVGFGGGATLDVVGFMGSILLRGIDCLYVPTTLLAQIDAAIGGKTAVNITTSQDIIKNMVGTYHHPIAVVSDVSLLRTLPKRELMSGLGEMAKYWMGWGRPAYDRLERTKRVLSEDSSRGDEEDLIQTILLCQQLKIGIVMKDPYENMGERMKLNLGHTVGHAIEGAASGRLSHGECVSLGMTASILISRDMRLLSPSESDNFIEMISRIGLPTSCSSVSLTTVMKLIPFDKKGGVWILLRHISDMVVVPSVPIKILRKVLKDILL
jgi:3-dehydroquinate synthase